MMTISKIEQITIFESPDGGKTVYARPSGSVDPSSRVPMQELLEVKLSSRWVKLKDAVFLNDPAINELLSQIETLYALKK
jgi:hypothetical protein